MDNKWSRLAWKQFFKYTGREDLWKQLKVKHSSVDLYVPEDDQVLNTLIKACRSSEALC
jgi:intergrase/recombinase